MKLRDLKTTDDVCVYVKEGYMKYDEKYKGPFTETPEELLDKEVVIIGAVKENLLDIQIRN